MKYTDYAEKLEVIKYLAEHKRAGSPRDLAQKLDISERTVQRMIQLLRDQGYPILFNRHRGCYEVKSSK